MNHDCITCGKQITWRFAICAECEQVYGKSHEWEKWLRVAWNYELRKRRSDRKFYDHTSYTDYDYQEDYREYMPDGNSFAVSNRNERRYENLAVMDEFIRNMDDVGRIVAAMHISGYIQSEIATILGMSRPFVNYRIMRLTGKRREIV